MSRDTIARFFRALPSDRNLRQQIEAIQSEEGKFQVDDVIPIAKANGYDFTAEEFVSQMESLIAVLNQSSTADTLDSEMLEAVSAVGLDVPFLAEGDGIAACC